MTELSLALPMEDTSEGLPAINPPFDPRLLVAIDAALRMAWDLLCSNDADRAILEADGEVKITQRLRAQLNRIRIKGGVPGYDSHAFERPYSGAEYYNYKGQSVRKPDLIFAVSGSPRSGVYDDLNDAIFVECKLIEPKGNKNVGQYCSNGLSRFVDGSYAWRMTQGMMIAYVRSDQRLPSALTDGMNVYGRAKALETDGSIQPCNLSKALPQVYLSDHARSWNLPEGVPPGVIQVRHLWLPVFPLSTT